MTKIEAYIRNQRLEEVQDALDALDIAGMTVIDVRGMGRSKGVTHTYRGSQYTLNLNPRLKLEIVVNDEQVDEVVEAIQRSASTGEVGDGKILIIPLAEVIRIRTGERGDAALS
ncbi:MAG TPA: P-II family nitrogen regulator [Fimbriimonas sp.]